MARRNLKGSRALITGASSGIGWHLALELSRQGVEVLVTARRESRLRELAELISRPGGTCHIQAGDISLETTRQSLVEFVASHWGGLDLLVNCAGVGAVGAFAEASSERLRRIFEINFFAAAELMRSTIPLLRNGRDAVIVNISSVLGHRAVPLKSEYCASKFALHGFSDALRAELARDGIGVLLVSPSTTDSEFFDVMLEDRAPRDWKGRRPMPPERVARIAVQAIRARKHEVILSAGGRALVWLDRLLPRLADRLIARWFQ